MVAVVVEVVVVDVVVVGDGGNVPKSIDNLKKIIISINLTLGYEQGEELCLSCDCSYSTSQIKSAKNVFAIFSSN